MKRARCLQYLESSPLFSLYLHYFFNKVAYARHMPYKYVINMVSTMKLVAEGNSMKVNHLEYEDGGVLSLIK